HAPSAGAQEARAGAPRVRLAADSSARLARRGCRRLSRSGPKLESTLRVSEAVRAARLAGVSTGDCSDPLSQARRPADGSDSGRLDRLYQFAAAAQRQLQQYAV